MAINYQAYVNINAKYSGGGAVNKAKSDFASLSGGLSKFKGAVSGLAAAFAVREVVQYTKSIIDLGDEMNDLRQKTGLSVNTLSGLKTAAELGGVSFEGLQSSLRKFTVNQGLAAAGSKEAAAGFQALRISITDANGKAKDSGVLLGDIAERFKAMPDGATKAAIAVKLFGKSGADMIPVLNEGRESLTRYGLAIGDDFAKQADQFNDSMTLLGTTFTQIGINTLKPLLPTLQSVAEGFLQITKAVAGTDGQVTRLGQILDLMKKIADVAGYLFKQSLLFKSNSAVFNGLVSLSTPDKAPQGLADSLAARSGIKEKSFTPDTSKLDASSDAAAAKRVERLKREMASIDDFRATKEQELELRRLELNRLNYTTSAYNKLQDAIKTQQETVRATNGMLPETAALYREAADSALEYRNALEDVSEQQKSSFGQGAKAAFHEYIEGAKDVAAQTKSLFLNAFGGVEDAIVEFVQTGKLNFADLARSIEADLIRIAFRQAVVFAATSAFGFADGGIMTGSGPAPLKKYASGGIANSPQLAMFGEGSTPEAFVPLPDGRSIPVTMRADGEAQASTGTSVTVNVNMAGGGDTENTEASTDRGKELGRVISAAVKTEIVNQMRPGGMLAKG